MKQEKIKNEKGEQMKTKDGVDVVKKTFEVGDEFIPVFNNISQKDKQIVTKKGDQKTITTYKIVVNIRDVNKPNEVNNNVWIDLTPSQANTIKKKLDAEIEINQHQWIVYSYKSEKYGDQIGIGIKRDNKPPISFDDI